MNTKQVISVPVIREVKETTELDLPFYGKIRGEVHAIRTDSAEVYFLNEDYSSITIKKFEDNDELNDHVEKLQQNRTTKLRDVEIIVWTEAEFNEFKKGVFEKLMNNDFSFKREVIADNPY